MSWLRQIPAAASRTAGRVRVAAAKSSPVRMCREVRTGGEMERVKAAQASVSSAAHGTSVMG